MDNRYEQRRLARIRRRQHKKKMRRRRNAAMGIVAAVVLFLSGSFIINRMNSNSSAMSTRVIEPSTLEMEKASDEETTPVEEVSIEYLTRDELEEKDLAPRTEKMQVSGYQEKLDTFLITSQDTVLYARNSTKANDLAIIPKGTYLETYGEEDGWTKVSYVGQVGYLMNKDLEVISDPTLFKVVDGKVIVNATYGLAESYQTVFSSEALSALRVMLESMGRDGLEVEVIAEARTYEQDKTELIHSGNPANAPQPGHTVFQTGRGVQFYVKGTDPRLDNHFEQTEQYQWLLEHAHEYGFVLRYPEGSEIFTGYRSDPTIFYFVGMEDATIMATENLTMEVFYGVH